MELLTPALQTYPWGSKTLLSELRGDGSPTTTPEAELWFGAHHAAPSTVGGRGLDQIISDDPEAALGARVRGEFGDNLPFLLKILAADTPLSVQAHPTREQAEAGYAAENAAGIDLRSGLRNYKDPNHKPELLVALTPFRALAGLRPASDTIALFEQLNCATLNRYTAMLHDDNEEEGLRALFTTWISLPRTKRVQLIDDIAAICATHTTAAGDEQWMTDVKQTFLELNEMYPGDVGVLASLLLNYVELAPGEALFLGAGRLHAYISGMAIEIMANSDNVLRGGLTTKHVDVPELVRILDFSTLSDPRVAAVERGVVTDYPVPVGDFVLSRHRFAAGGSADDALEVAGDGPAIVLCTAGAVVCGDVRLTPGTAAWIPAEDGPVEVASVDAARSGLPAEVFYARV